MAVQIYPYNISPKIRVSLDAIKHLRSRIHLYPLSRMQERQIKWNSKISKIHWSLAIAGGSFTRPQIAKLLVNKDRAVFEDDNHELSSDELEAIYYNSALEYIDYEWFASNDQVNADTVLNIYKLSSDPELRYSVSKFNAHKSDINAILEYLQTGSEDAIIQSGIAQVMLRLISPFENYNGKITRLLSNLFLYKHGLDFRGLLIMEEYIRRDIVSYRTAVDSATSTQNLTAWLEYYTDGMATQLEKSMELLRSPVASLGVPRGFWELNERQKSILTILENPEETITNREVQERFEVSQITASRDLTTLTKMGMLIPRGKGRSVKYVRIG